MLMASAGAELGDWSLLHLHSNAVCCTLVLRLLVYLGAQPQPPGFGANTLTPIPSTHSDTPLSAQPGEKAALTLTFHPWEDTSDQGVVKRVLK